LLRGSRLLRRVSPRIAQALELLPVDAAGVAAVSPGEVAPRGEQRAAVLFFTGCATSTLTPATVGHALAVLSHNGCAVRCPTAQTCCGAIHYHAGRRFEARELARANIDAFDGDGPVVNIAAGCGAMMKHYPDLLSDDPHYADRARRFVARVRDIAEFLIEFGPRRPERSLAKDIASGGSPPMRVTYHDACHHAHAQGIRRQPRELLRMIPGVELVECESSDLCCGAAGSYNLTQPRVAAELGRRKLDTLLAGGASVVATGNVGCILHLQAVARRAGVDLRVAHTIDLLSEAYGDADAAG
jgi:glycolate oxidase iron-sulfur subunit